MGERPGGWLQQLKEAVESSLRAPTFRRAEKLLAERLQLSLPEGSRPSYYPPNSEVSFALPRIEERGKEYARLLIRDVKVILPKDEKEDSHRSSIEICRKVSSEPGIDATVTLRFKMVTEISIRVDYARDGKGGKTRPWGFERGGDFMFTPTANPAQRQEELARFLSRFENNPAFEPFFPKVEKFNYHDLIDALLSPNLGTPDELLGLKLTHHPSRISG